MDVAYDHIQEEVLSPDEASGKEQTGTEEAPPTLNTEFAEAYKAISATPWGARFGSFVGNVRKQVRVIRGGSIFAESSPGRWCQGETYYEGARQEYTAASSQASKGFNQIMDRTRSLSLKQPESTAPTSSAADASQQGDSTSSDSTSRGPPRSASEALQDSDGIIFRFRTEATKRLKDIEKAEDAADEALLKFGTNIRNFFREAIAIAPPAAGEGAVDENGKSTVLFESKDRDGKRVIHTTRFDAQLHVIHSTRDGFLNDPVSAEYSSWKEGFEVEKQTEAISKDLEKFEELRAAMAHLVPDQVRYEDFWARYYFLRHVVETEEQKRREMLRGESMELCAISGAWLICQRSLSWWRRRGRLG